MRRSDNVFGLLAKICISIIAIAVVAFVIYFVAIKQNDADTTSPTISQRLDDNSTNGQNAFDNNQYGDGSNNDNDENKTPNTNNPSTDDNDDKTNDTNQPNNNQSNDNNDNNNTGNNDNNGHNDQPDNNQDIDDQNNENIDDNNQNSGNNNNDNNNVNDDNQNTNIDNNDDNQNGNGETGDNTDNNGENGDNNQPDNNNNNDDNNGDNNGENNEQNNDNNNQNDDTNQNNGENGDNNGNQSGDTGDSEYEDDGVINIVGFGDSISAGYAPYGNEMYGDYVNYVNGNTDINQLCFTKLIANSYESQNEEVAVNSYAESGDKTADLIAKLQNTQKYPNLENDVKNADIITLCIGANNILGVLLDDNASLLVSYLMGTTSEEEIRAIFENGYQQFVDDFDNTIIPYLTQGNAKVYAMTIYSPYKWFDGNEITISTNDDFVNNIIAGMVEVYLGNFNPLRDIAMEYIDRINEHIMACENENLFVVDVADAFDKLSKDEFLQYVNANSGDMEIYIDGYQSVNNISNNPKFDPHPTKQGQEFIASVYLTALQNQGE